MSQQPRILAFAGSARTGSYNKMLVRIAAEGARRAGAATTCIDLRDFPLPIYDADIEKHEGIPENAMRIKALLTENDGLLIASPEYNSGITPLLKNVIDWASRPLPGERSNAPINAPFQGKLAAILAASTGALGGIRGLMQLRLLLEHMRVMVIPDQKAIPKAGEAFAPDGSLRDKVSHEAVEAVGASLARFVVKFIG
jgi:NAD(P)H-dependent FMN reductase